MNTQELFNNIFYGGVYPAEKTYEDDEQYMRLYEAAALLEAKLFQEENITVEQRDAIEKVQKAYEKVWKYQMTDQFKDGFCLGGRLAISMMETHVETVIPTPESDELK